MKRQTDESITSRVYQYGCVPERIAPVGGKDEEAVQLRLATRLWNVLCAIEHARVARYRAIMYDADQERIDALGEQMKADRQRIKDIRKVARKRVPNDPALRAEIEALTERIAEAKAERVILLQRKKETSKARHEAKRAELSALAELTKRRIKRARQAAGSLGLYWGTYNDIVQRADAARKHHGELQFRRFRGDGTLTAQIIGGAAVGKCVGGDHTFFQAGEPLPGQKHRRARVRIGSTDDRDPEWLDVPMVMHRPIPPNALIKSVSATKRGDKRTINVTVTLPKPPQKRGREIIALDIGWRLLPQGVRVGYWLDGEGKHGEIVVGQRDLAEIGRMRSLREICDRNLNDIVPSLAEWLNGTHKPDRWPDVSTVSQWRSSGRLAAFVRAWSDFRVEGDAEIFEAACEWRKQYLHLSNWWRRLSERTPLRLREQYRVFAARVARKYATICVEKFDIGDVAEVPKPEEKDGRKTSPLRVSVSPSAFRGALLSACRREGLRVLELPAKNTTRACHVCGHAGKWDQAQSVMHRCDGCGSTWDQDYNAAANLLRMGLASGPVMPTPNQPLVPPLRAPERDPLAGTGANR